MLYVHIYIYIYGTIRNLKCQNGDTSPFCIFFCSLPCSRLYPYIYICLPAQMEVS